MRRRTFAGGAAVVMAAALWLLLYNLTAAQIERGGPGPTRTSDLGPSPTVVPGATPTIDRLAAPPTVSSPTQADEGAQLYWLHCQPCHGDQGQGLTDEWRAQYPPEDQYCWDSGCHGSRPYDPAFQLPTAVPAVIGDRALARFQTLDGVYQYVSVAMPYFFPGDLTQEEYLAILAHLARANGIGNGAPLTRENLAAYHIPWALAPAATPQPATPQPATTPPGVAPRIGTVELAIIVVIVALLLAGGMMLWLRRGRSN